MSASLNRASLIGNLGRDPELRYSPNGTPVCSLNLATTRSYKVNDEWKEETEWHRIAVFGPLGERVAEKARKGASLFVEGRLHTRTYDKADQKHYATEIIADTVTVLVPGRSPESQPE